MNLTPRSVPIEALRRELELWCKQEGRRIGMLSSITGAQLVVVLLDLNESKVELWESELKNNAYTSLTLSIPQLHWSERVLWNIFGIVPQHHPRLKPPIMQEHYPTDFFMLRRVPLLETDIKVPHDAQRFLEVHGEGVWELPVGPIHAGVIEPGHFRFSCLGETIVNLELKLGYVHRGVSKHITEVPWQKARFVAEAAASDTAAANALAHAIAIESICQVEVSAAAQTMRTLALEIERAAMHIVDIGGMMTDVGLISMAATMSKLRGMALGLGQSLSGSRFLRGFILPGGVISIVSQATANQMKEVVIDLRNKLRPLITMLRDNQAAIGRMDGIGTVKRSLAEEFGLVGVAARASGIAYDTRKYFEQGLYPKEAPVVALETAGDNWARTNVRIKELWNSLAVLEHLLAAVPEGEAKVTLPERLPANQRAVGIVESFRGELIHFCVTGDDGTILRYAIKDASFNNWTAVPIAVRDNLIADFPSINKSFALSYSGNDL